MPHVPTAGAYPDDYEARYDMETLQRAEQIKKDPNRLSRMKAYAARTAAELAKVAGEGEDKSAESSLMKGYRSL